MDIFNFSDGLQQQLKAMAESARSKEPLAHASEMINLVEELLHDLRQFTYNYTFNSTQEEIRFFKDTKPVLLSQYYYYKKLFDIALFDSFKDAAAKMRYYESVLARLEEFARKNNEFYLYCMAGQTHFDDTYFSRKEKTFSGLMDTRFSTGYDDKLAKLLANELIRKHVLNLLNSIGQLSLSPITWTGNKTDAIELLVALHSLGSINNGNIELRKLVQGFEERFNIQLENYYDFLKNIRTRKGRTSFLDTLKEKLLQRLEQMEG